MPSFPLFRPGQRQRTRAAESDRPQTMSYQRSRQSAKGLPVTFAAVSKNSQVLERAGLVDRQKQGRSYYFQLRKEPLSRAEEVLHKLIQFWSERLDALAELAEAEGSEAQTLKTRKR